ncbi:hypothetical protein I4U23_012477 [Adineta vaga]|nr:hypothetical protein I4U23_012477 [Adineta vaga]
MATQTDKRRRKNKKLVIVGDGMCGKTCLLFAFKDKQFLSTHEPTIFETYPTEIQVDGKLINLTLFDTAGQEDYERLRALSYADTNIALICFSVDSPVSVISVIENWMPEVQEFCDEIDNHELYHQIIAKQLASIFLPVSSLREDKKRINQSVSIEFLQFYQHLLNNPNKKILFMITNHFKKYFNQSSYAALLIQRGKPSLIIPDMPINNLDIWNSLEKTVDKLQSTLILNNDQLRKNLLEKLILQPYEKKFLMNKAYLYWLKKKFSLDNLEEQLYQGILLCENIILQK